MEERPWTKSEFFAWSDGRRIVDLYELSKQLHCKQCSNLLDLRRTEREARYGLASILYILCNCGVMNDVHTGRTQQDGGDSSSPNPMYEINIKASINLLMYGAGASRILSFLALLDIPVPPPDDTSLIVPVIEDGDMGDLAAILPPPSASSSSSGPRPPPAAAQPNASAPAAQSQVAASSSSSFQKSQPSDPSSSFDPDPGFRPVPLPPRHDDEEDNVLPVADSDDDNDTGGVHDDDEEYKPRSKSKTKLKPPAPTPSPKKKAPLRGPKSARAKQAAKLAAAKKSKPPPVKLKVKVKPVKTPKKEVVDEDFEADKVAAMDWSSSETEIEDNKDKESDESWNEGDAPEETTASASKRKRGRPRGASDKGKRAKKGSPPKKRGRVSKADKEKEGEGEDKDIPKCEACAKDFSSIKGYNVHMKRVHNQEMKVTLHTNTNGPVPKGEFSETAEDMDRSVYWCPLCSALSCNLVTYEQHAKKLHPDSGLLEKLFPLSLKEVVSKTKRTYENNVSVMHYRCLKCQQAYRSPFLMAGHLRVTSKGVMTCTTFSSRGARIRSQMVRRLFCGLKATLHLCVHCGKTLKNKKSLKQHVFAFHTDKEKTVPCHDCGLLFYSKYHLNVHRVMHDPNRRKFVCDLCGKEYIGKNGLRTHISSFHKPPSLPCSVCPKLFHNKRNLLNHMLSHNKQAPKFPCDLCPLAFTNRYNLTVHRRIHTGEKPYACTMCGEAFAQKNSLNVHVRKHGLEIKTPRRPMTATVDVETWLSATPEEMAKMAADAPVV